MILDIALVSTLAGGALLVDQFLRMKVERRRILNRLLAVASEDFHNATQSMLKTPEDLPDSVLDALSIMSESGFSRGSERQFLRAMRVMRETPAPKSRLSEDSHEMRPELETLFRKAAVAWFNIMTHKSGRYHRKIFLEAMKANADRIAPDRQAIGTASGMQASPC